MNKVAKKRLTDIKGFLVDLDGTTYLSKTALPGAVDFFAHLKSKQIPFQFFSNNPTKSMDEYVEHIKQFGIEVEPENIITSTQATIKYLMDNDLGSIYAVGTPGFESELEQAGIKITEKNPQAVLISFDLTLTYDKLKQASLLLSKNPDLPYIATNPDLVCPTEEGPIPDCGAIIAYLKASTNRTPKIIGKPHSGMVDLALERLNLAAEDLAVIGDRLYTDIKMGHDHGLTTILVLSGETNKSDLESAGLQPDYVMADLAAVLREISSN